MADIRSHVDLVLCSLLAITAAVALVLSPEWQSPLRVLLGFVLVMLVPGYVLHVLAFPRLGQVRGVERLALTIGLSIIVMPLVGLFLNYTPWGVRPVAVAVALAVLVSSTAGIAAQRRRSIPGHERFVLAPGRRGFATTVTLGGIVVATIAGVVTSTLSLRPDVGFTEFYVLDEEGELRNFPRSLNAGQAFELTVGVSNREDEAGDYLLRPAFAGNPPLLIGRLAAGATWERVVTFTAPPEEGCVNLRFELEKKGSESPYRELELFVPVGPTTTAGLDGKSDCP